MTDMQTRAGASSPSRPLGLWLCKGLLDVLDPFPDVEDVPTARLWTETIVVSMLAYAAYLALFLDVVTAAWGLVGLALVVTWLLLMVGASSRGMDAFGRLRTLLATRKYPLDPDGETDA